MIGDVWLPLSEREKTLLLDALTTRRPPGQAAADEIDALALKLVRARSCPQITVGVQGGQIQWALGNPFPIRVCDYDTGGDELPDIDERGQPCRIWFEPADPDFEELS
jgi:hypothetical protein